MIQFYFLSIFFNAIAGYMLITEEDRVEKSISDRFQLSFDNDTLRMILGVLSMVTGLLKLLSSVQGDVPVIGDFIPAVAGFAAGFILVFEYYREHSLTADTGKYERAEGFLMKNKRWIGFAVLAAAVLHFLFPQVLLL
jgi:hypothetical protein